MPWRCGQRSTSLWRDISSLDTGNFGTENKVGISTTLWPFKSHTSMLTTELSNLLLSFSMVVRASVVWLPLTASFFVKNPVINDVLEPPSRNAYVSTVRACPFAFTFTGTIGNPVTRVLRLLPPTFT